MAKRSDFAQKLLDDLRIRKERMAAPPQTSNRSNATAIDAYAYSKQTHKGSREARTNGTIITRNGTSQTRSTGSGRPIRQESSNQMVACGSGGSSGQIVDLSMALTFALENGATKLTRTSSSSKSSVMGFLNQIGKGSANRYWGSNTSSQFPNLSNFHIEEISKGAQKLNQILRACSSGVKADTFSIEIGKELFKGAVDLEESLRMLVNLQEASQYMNHSQRKSRITLLDEDEDEEDNKEDQKQVDLPRFSFDRSRRHARKTDLKPKMQAALTYFTGGSTDENQGRIMSTSNVKNPSKLPGQKESSKPEKDRIPSVIAKLMGLDELPKNESMKSTTTTQKDNNSSKQKGERSVKTKEGNKNPLMPKSPSFLLQVENVRPPNNVGLEMVIHDGKQAWTDFAASKPVTGSGKTTIKTDRQQIKQNSGKDHHEKESARKQYSVRYADQKFQVRKQYTEAISKSASNKVVKQPLPIQARVSKKTMAEDVNAMKFKGGYHENLARRKSSPTELNIHKNDSSQKKVVGFGPVMKEKHVHHAAQIDKEKIRRVNRTENPRRMDEVVVARRDRVPNKLTRPLKESTLQEATHRNHDKLSGKISKASRLKQVEPPHIVKSNKSAENSPALNVSQNQHKQPEASTLYVLKEDEFRCLKELRTLPPTENCQNSVIVVPNDQKHQAPIFGDDDCLTLPNALSGTQDDTLDISQHRSFKWRKQEPLTETETQLKQILIGSQMFLNTAEALFRLEIPFGILHDSIVDKNINKCIHSKLKLDCSYEVMKRRGRRQELLSLHPNRVNYVSLSFVRIESLDELVKQLWRDMEALRMYGKNGREECEVEEYVPKMLEIDVNNWESEVNCMWDLGWDVNVYGIVEVDEVVRDLERLVFSGLVDEVARELFHICVTA